jgi:hypothetical protein
MWDGVLEFVLSYGIGEVASARSWRMTEGSPCANTDPSVSSITKPKGVMLDPLPLRVGEDLRAFSCSSKLSGTLFSSLEMLS